MENQEKSYIDSIQSLIRGAIIPNHGANLYQQTHESHLSMGDESGIHNWVYSKDHLSSWLESNPDKEDMVDAIDKILSRHIMDLIPEGFYTISNDGLVKLLINDNNDIVKIQFTDHSLYIMIQYSGQY